MSNGPRDDGPEAPTLAISDELAPTITPGDRGVNPGAAAALGGEAFADRYARGAVLGSGGMGEVRACRDARIGRDVAIKVMRAGRGTHDDLRARFLREARVQGQLEHPAIVPVYDLGVDPDGAPYFTMKQLRGDTLADIVANLADSAAAPAPHKLLGDFARVCQAVEYAHSRGVLHRDLKPSNIMLGAFGEVYVLDWGVAKVAGVDDAELPAAPVAPDSADTGPHTPTATGAVLGTPGYMAPEQLRGDAIDERADVYALGCILFELLALQPLHDRRTPGSIAASTFRGDPVRPSERAPDRDIAPELDSICARATALEPAYRFATVAELRDQLERYLAGDRDLARRRELAATHAAAAQRELAAALDGDNAARRRAMREVSRALALDPEHAGAADAAMSLLVTPPRETPPEVVAAVERSTVALSQYEARMGVVSYGLIAAFGPIFVWMGVRDWLTFGVMAAAFMINGVSAGLYGYARRPTYALLFTAMLINAVAVAITARLFGPFILVPGIAAGSTVMFTLHHRPRWVPLAIAAGVAAVVVPVALQLAGLWPSSYAFVDGAMVVVPDLVDLPRAPTLVALGASAVIVIVAPALSISKLHRRLVDSEQRLQTQAWQLRHALPDPAGDGQS